MTIALDAQLSKPIPTTGRDFEASVTAFLDEALSMEAFERQLRSRAAFEAQEIAAKYNAEAMVDFDNGQEIEIVFLYMREAVRIAWETLKAKSPVNSGDYRDAFFLEVTDPNPDAQEVIIGNRMPYNRRVEYQMIGNRKLSFSTPPFLYEDAKSSVEAAYGQTIECEVLRDWDFEGKYQPIARPKREQFNFTSPALRIKMIT